MKKSLRAMAKKHLRGSLAVEPLECRELLSAWTASATQLITDPIQGQTVPFGAAQVSPQTGNVRLEQALDFRQSVRNAALDDQRAIPDFFDLQVDSQGRAALVYNSDTVTVRPIITAALASDPQAPVPIQLQVRLSWNGQQQPW